MAKRRFLDYEIHLTDAQQVADLQAADIADAAVLPTFPTGGWAGWIYPFTLKQVQAPLKAAVEFTAPIYDPEGRLATLGTPNYASGPFTPPEITSEWFYSKENFPLDQDGFRRKSGGWFGIPFLFGTNTFYYWRRKFVYGGDGAASDQPYANLAGVRFLDGFEILEEGDGGSAISAQYTRDSSRHGEGFGYAFREDVGSQCKTHPVAGGPTDQWDRFYIRLRAKPTGTAQIWKSRNSGASSNMGIVVGVDSSGALALGSVSAVSAITPHASSGTALTLNKWARVDVLIRYRGAAGANTSRVELYINGVQQVKVTAPSGLEENASGVLSTSLGRVDNLAWTSQGLECDLDDWKGAALPVAITWTGDGVTAPFVITTVDTFNGGGTKQGRDWLLGSRMQKINVTGIAAQGGWTGVAGAYRLQLKNPGDGVVPASEVAQSSIVNADLIIFDTDADKSVDALPRFKGVASMVVAMWNRVGGATNGSLGYKLPGAAVVDTAVDNPNATFAFNQVVYAGPGTAIPLPLLKGLQLRVTHPASVELMDIAGVHAVAELLGIWGDEDPRPTTTGDFPPLAFTAKGIHNAPYPRSPWAKSGLPPFAPYAVVAGTYVGTGASLDLSFDYPVHWVFVRRVNPGALQEAVEWWSSMIASHVGVQDHAQGNLLLQQLIDPAYQAAALDAREVKSIIRISSESHVNNLGSTYQYLAVADPAARFMLNGTLSHLTGAGARVNLLADTRFKPEAAWFINEKIGTTAVVRMGFKGAGHAVNSGKLLDNTAEDADYAAFGVGSVTSRTGLHLSDAMVAFSAWRRDDSSGDPGIVKVVQLGSYVGDGVSPKTVDLAPASGCRPVFAMVVPHTAAHAIWRDPSHTGTLSNQMNGTEVAANGIRGGGIDQLIVGANLNTAGITYDVFVIPGDTTDNGTGFGSNGTFVPVEPDNPNGSQWDEFPDDFEDFEGDNPFADGATSEDTVTQPPELDGDLAVDCVDATHKVVNIALSRVGISKAVEDIGTEASVEADQARLHYTEVVEAVLREFPWPFATKYATLVLVAGTTTVAVNDDWQYSYRKPADLIFARRVVAPGKKRVHDPAPPPFRMSNDAADGQQDTGDLIFTDEADAVLEYTRRPTCAAGAGDALYRDALAWRLAHAFAPALAKDEKRTAYCWEMYKQALRRATPPSANEQERQQPLDGNDYLDARD